MPNVPPDLIHRLRSHGQEHLLFGWNRLDDRQRADLADQLAGIDFDTIARLFSERNAASAVPSADRLAPIPCETDESIDATARQLGHEALARGELAALLVAGGQGTRLGFDNPKGMLPIGPVTNRTLFQIHADKVFALSRRYGRPVPYLVMTSPATHADTEGYFREHGFFGLGESNVYFFQQGSMPAVDIATGRILLESPGLVFTSPNGHGGTLTALSESGLLNELERRGIRHIYYFQVDNPLAKIGDPAFFGRHLMVESNASSKAIAKAYPKEKMGVFALIDGRCGIVEYSDLPDDLAHMSDRHGRLTYRAGNPAIHLFAMDFLRQVTRGTGRLPYHIACKKVPYIDEAGNAVNPTNENALKFEMFIFDALPLAERWLIVESLRCEEFSPVKNASGPDSPETTKRDLSNLAANWLAQAGVKVPRDAAGHAAFPIEISPRFAFDAAELAARIHGERVIDSPTCLE